MIIGSFCKIPSISDSDAFVFFACPLAPALMWRKVWLELLRWTGREASELHFISSQPRVRKKRKDSTSTRSKAALLFKLFFPAFLPDCYGLLPCVLFLRRRCGPRTRFLWLRKQLWRLQRMPCELQTTERNQKGGQVMKVLSRCHSWELKAVEPNVIFSHILDFRPFPWAGWQKQRKRRPQ